MTRRTNMYTEKQAERLHEINQELIKDNYRLKTKVNSIIKRYPNLLYNEELEKKR